ncbi:xanthine dehydrogenase family protein molybdopterin-binding subunit [Sciscionella sediminilitoris]|uniref:xanthine dehydrogenase family protein molybdopterin-binding subunit n=1 Tax=Sciscionella sediminilitoris TaxID=1445613 RepID=UPI0004DFAC98|nr:xanthine dehydrogenase family protein molybdopterin-binding subunit [Sciscionella sp. SE31]
MTELLETNAVGTEMLRVDGAAKVTGTAPYAYEADLADAVYCTVVQAGIARGRVMRMHTTEAEAMPGVLRVLTLFDAERIADTSDTELAIMQDDRVPFRGRIIGLVIAESSETARHAADRVVIEYEQWDHDVVLGEDRQDLYASSDFAADSEEGDVRAALPGAAVRIERRYATAMTYSSPLEPHASTALWDKGTLTLWDSTQGVHPARATIASLFGLPQERVRVVCPYVGGGFGSKGTVHAHTVVASLAARLVPGRPVRLALTRQQMFIHTGYRTPTIQRIRLGADDEGRLSAIAVDVVEQTSRIKEFAEQSAMPARVMYAAPNRHTTHRLAALDVPVPSWVRAPGECPGMFGPEVAMDELASELNIDPIELRVRNEPARDPDTGKPFSTRNLVACLRTGAKRFGWAGRDPRPRTRRDGDWLLGTGVAASMYPVNRQEATARIRYTVGRYTVEIGAAELGTGTWTTLRQIAADALAMPTESVELRIGDTAYPTASVAGGSSGMTTWGTAVVDAARAMRKKFGAAPPDGAEAHGKTSSNPAAEQYAMYAFGAQFAEVRVHADTREIQVSRLHGTFAAGRIINPVTARSQLLGGMTMGLSMALHENGICDPCTGHVVNDDLAEYHVPTNADIAEHSADWIDEHDPYVNPIGSKGIGEIGIVGTAAAVVNAIYHATGIRVRDLPVTLDKLF